MKQIISNLELSFKQRYGKINWDQVRDLDLETILSQGDIESLQSVLENLTYSILDRDDIQRIGDSNLIKVFKLSQLAMEYLISIHAQLDTHGKDFLKKQKKLYQDNQELKDSLTELEKEVNSLKSEFTEKQKAVKTYELLLKQPNTAVIMNKVVTRANAITCEYCKKAFISSEFLEDHKKRRHIDTSNESSASKDIGPILEIFKTFTEQRIQAVTESHRRELESLKELMKIQLEIQRDNENSSFQKLLMMQSQQINIHEDYHNKLLIETQYEKDRVTRAISEDIKKIEERDRVLASLKENNFSLSRELREKENEFMSREVSIDGIEVTGKAFKLDPDDDRKTENRSFTPPPPQFISENRKKSNLRVLTVGSHERQIINPVSIEEGYDYEIPILRQNSPELLIPKTVESNAGDIEDDSDYDLEIPRPESNAGDIESDSDQSIDEYTKPNVFRPENIDNYSEDMKDLSVDSEKIDPKTLDFKLLGEETKQTNIINLQKPENPDINKEEIAKSLGIDPVKDSRYMNFTDLFLQEPLPEPWIEIIENDQKFYYNQKTNQKTSKNPNIEKFSSKFLELKDTHSKISEKINLISIPSNVFNANLILKGIPSYFYHDQSTFRQHRDKILAEEDEKYEDLIVPRELKNHKRRIRKEIEKIIKEEKSKELVIEKEEKSKIIILSSSNSTKKVNNQNLDLFKSIKEIKDQNSELFKSAKDVKDHERSLWSYKQGIDHIQNQNILKESPSISSNQLFQEGSVLGEHYFDKNSGVNLEENIKKRVIIMQEEEIRSSTIIKLKERSGKKYDFEY
jgi:Iguana/Dzip1-like DAZ-interacting protein N-terminal